LSITLRFSNPGFSKIAAFISILYYLFIFIYEFGLPVGTLNLLFSFTKVYTNIYNTG
jgi:hypothetical protein